LFFLKISQHLRTRAIATTGLLLYIIAGAGCFFINDIYLLLLMRAVLGISVGLIMPLSTGLLAYYFIARHVLRSEIEKEERMLKD
jgi:MFS family permease